MCIILDNQPQKKEHDMKNWTIEDYNKTGLIPPREMYTNYIRDHKGEQSENEMIDGFAKVLGITKQTGEFRVEMTDALYHFRA